MPVAAACRAILTVGVDGSGPDDQPIGPGSLDHVRHVDSDVEHGTWQRQADGPGSGDETDRIGP